MAAGAPLLTESEGDVKLSKYAGAPPSLPKHSYWFDFWVFVVFDFALFFFIQYIIP